MRAVLYASIVAVAATAFVALVFSHAIENR